MKVSSESLKRAWNIAKRAVSPNSPKPILQCCRVTSNGGEGLVTGTNLEIWCLGRFECEGDIDVVLNAKRFSDWLSAVDGEIVIEVDKSGKATIKSERSQAVLPTAPADEFPGVPRLGGEKITVSSALSGLISRVSFLQDDEATGHAGRQIGGLCIQVEDGVMYLSNTDGNICSVASLQCESSDNAQCKLTEQFVRVAKSCLSGESFLMVIDENVVSVDWDGGAIFSRQMSGDPTYVRRGISTFSCDKDFIAVSAGAFRAAVQQVSAVASDIETGIRLVVSEGSIVLSVKSEIGSAESELPVASNGEQADESYSRRYILSLARFCDPSDSLEFRIHDGEINSGMIELRTADGALTYLAGLEPKERRK